MDQFIEVLQRPDFVGNVIIHIEYLVLATLLGIVIAIPVAVLVNRSNLPRHSLSTWATSGARCLRSPCWS